MRVLHAKLASDLATLPILNPTNPTQVPKVLQLQACFALLVFLAAHALKAIALFPEQEEVLALALWHTPRGRWWPLDVRMPAAPACPCLAV